MIEKETGTLEDPRFKFSTEPRHFTFMGRPHVAHYPKCTAKIYQICSTPMSQMVSKMVKLVTARKKEQICRRNDQPFANERERPYTFAIV